MLENDNYHNYLKKVITQNQNYLNINDNNQFIDDLFPPNENSIGISPSTSSSNYNQIKWKRISEIFQEFYLVRILKNESELIDDVVQGDLGDCYFLSALSALAERKKRIEKMFSDIIVHQNGLYKIKVYLNGKPTNVIIDDLFPVIEDLENKFKLAFSNIEIESKNIWPILLEKVWAKVNLSYNNIVEGNVAQAFEFLTPCPIEVYQHNFNNDSLQDSKTKLLNKIKKADLEDGIICCDISNNQNINNLSNLGLLTNHAYSIISIHDIDYFGENLSLLKIRNPWGSLEWNGDWSDDSNKWTQELREKFELNKAKDDGVFFMSFRDYCLLFSTTYICLYNIEYEYVYKEFEYYFEMGNFIRILMKIENSNDKNDFDHNSGYFVFNNKTSKIYKNFTQNKKFVNDFVSVYIFEINSQKCIGSTSGRFDRLSIKGKFNPGDYLILIKFMNSQITKENFTENIENNFILNFDEFLNNKNLNHYNDNNNSITKNFVVGLYSNHHLNSSSINFTIFNNTEINIQKLFFTSIINLTNNPEENLNIFHPEIEHFYKEGEPDIIRYMNYANDNDAFGFIIYINVSNSFINEKLIFDKIENIKIVKYDQNLGKSILNDNQDNFIFYEDENESKLVNQIIQNENNLIIENLHSYNDNLIIKIPPYSYFVILFEKLEENSIIKYDSQINLSYPISYLWSEKKFLFKKQRIKYKEDFINIFESIIRHNNGVLFIYKNKTKQYKIEIKIILENLKNCEFKLNEENNNELENYLINFNLLPGECNYAEINSLNIFEAFSFTSNINYEIKLI